MVKSRRPVRRDVPTNAIVFGDYNDANSELSQLFQETGAATICSSQWIQSPLYSIKPRCGTERMNQTRTPRLINQNNNLQNSIIPLCIKNRNSVRHWSGRKPGMTSQKMYVAR